MYTYPERQQGSALIVTITVMTVMGLMVVGLLMAVGARDDIERFSSQNEILAYAAETGVSRAKFMVARHTDEETGENWLKHWAGTGGTPPFVANTPGSMKPITWDDGNDYFDIGDDYSGTARVRVFVLDTAPASTDAFRTWYIVIARAEMGETSSSIAMSMRPRDLFSRYARFVSNTTLSIGADASYHGEVHSNADISLGGANIKFHERTTCAGSFNGSYYDSSNTKGAPYTKFLKDHQDHVGTIQLPEASEIEDLGANPPADAVMYDARNVDFKNKCNDETGYTPASTDKVNVDFVWKNDKMDTVVKVYNSSGTLKASFTETDANIPLNSMLYVNGNASCKGNFSSRASIICTKSVTFDGPVRYVNDSGDPQYTLYKNGSTGGFNATYNEWSDTCSWKGSEFDYRQTDGWSKPSHGNNPCLGVVSSNDIYIDTMYRNAEIHAFLFSSNGVVTPTGSYGTQDYNLYCLGGLITTGTNPLSGTFKYRQYVYDKNVMSNPPPYFPTAPTPSFKNWHVVGSDAVDIASSEYKLTLSNVEDLFF